MNAYQEFVYNADQHDTSAKTFSFPIYSNGSRTIPARAANRRACRTAIDLITALAMHPETARRLARKFWNFFVSEIHQPDPGFVESMAAVYLQNRTEIRPVVRHILTSPWFNDPSMRHARYSWPAEFVARAIKEVGWQNFSLDKVRVAAGQHGPAALRAAERRRMAARGRLVLDGDDAGANEFRRHAGRQPEGAPRRPRWQPEGGNAAGAACRHARSRDAGAVRPATPAGAL